MSEKRSKKKPIPLFGLFRKHKTELPVASPPPPDPVFTSLPNPAFDPYTPPPRTGDSSPSRPSPEPRSTGRPRSKSSAAATRQHAPLHAAHRARSLTAREQTLNKLCQREHSPVPSPSQSTGRSPRHARPPVPQIPSHHHHHQPASPSRSPRVHPAATPPMSPALSNPARYVRPSVSAHDLRKATRHHQEAVSNMMATPLPTMGSPIRNRTPPFSPAAHDIDDDDVPLATIRKEKPIFSNDDEEDDRDLVPIATLHNTRQGGYLSAAEKFKEKAREHLGLDKDDDEPLGRR